MAATGSADGHQRLAANQQPSARESGAETMPRSHEIQQYMRNQIIDLYQSGKGYKAIAKSLGVHLSTARAIIHKWRKYGTVVNLPRSGRPCKRGTGQHDRDDTNDLRASLASFQQPVRGDVESSDAVSETDDNVDMVDPDPDSGLCGDVEEGDEEDAPPQEMDSKETESEDPETDPSPSTATREGDEPDRPPETGPGPEVNAEGEESEDRERKDKSVSEDEGAISEAKQKEKEADLDLNKDTQEDESSSSKLRVSTASDLDEMMDIGTVDEVEQESQMEQDEGREKTTAVQTLSSPCSPNAEGGGDDDDVKPTIVTPSEEDEDHEEPEKVVSSPAERGSSSPTTTMNGMRTRSKTALAARSPSPPVIKVKDEPEDDEYDQALVSSTSGTSVKDEPSTTKEDLAIGSVFSVPPPAVAPSLPVVHPSSSHMSCFHCKKGLQKGQTAFQRRGCPALFCSTNCLASSLPTNKGPTVSCCHCQKIILRPQDIILSQDAKGAMREFCSQSCLTGYSFKRRTAFKKADAAKTLASKGLNSLCSVCNRYGASKHEVILNDAVHKICSDGCFSRFRSVNNLALAACANCGSYCHGKSLSLKLDGGARTLCNANCLSKYKEKTKLTQPCTMCRTVRVLSEMVDNKNDDDTVNLFCSSSCVMAHVVQTVSSSGARVNCDNCTKNTVPAYHLAMSDTSIRNFCSLPCVMAYQESFKKSQKQMNVFTKSPAGSSDSPSPLEKEAPRDRLDCAQCERHITFKPEIVHTKDKTVFVCNAECSREFKKDNFVSSLCEYCKVEKIVQEVKRINNTDCYFCSDGCRLLFSHDLTKSWGKHCDSCVHCHCASKRLVTAQYGGSTEKFCSEECRSKHTMLFCHVAKCDQCGSKGKLKQNLPLLGAVKYFCNLSCLLQFCISKVVSQEEAAKNKREATPVIANVISLAGSPTGNTKAAERRSTRQTRQSVAQAGRATSYQSKNSAQTETVRSLAPPPPPSYQKVLKNKALLCKPLVQNKGVSCKAQTSDSEAQTEDPYPKVMIVPVPVPVYVPVPMGMYSQCTPHAVGLPLPMPVPMLLPVTTTNADRIIETIQEIKDKIPEDPCEADLILMADMVAEQTEPKGKDGKPKGKGAKTDRSEAPAVDDHASTYSDDLDTDDLASLLNNWEDNSSDAALRSLSRPYSQEKLHPIVDIPVGMDSEPYAEPVPPAPPPMDVETDFTIETLERMARLREHSQRSPSPPPMASKRKQAARKARDKKGRKWQRSTKEEGEDETSQKGSYNRAAATLPKLQSRYGVDAWKRWIEWRQTQPNLVKPRFGSRPMELKEDLLRCTTTELSYGLCCFISEVKRPNGEEYEPDSLFYLCLGIQQYLFENGRLENVFTDRFYTKFSSEFTDKLRGFQPLVTESGYIHSRVEEEFLWECKQLGAYSPIVLLNTLLFFCCKYFGFTTVEQHRQLSFAHVMRCTKNNPDNSRITFLRFYPPISGDEAEAEPEIPAKKRKEDEGKEDVLEMVENPDNPLRCPVRLYEFYLSKCSESVKQRTNVFYLLPERCCVPNSPLWFSATELDDSTMDAMLTRILTVRELHVYLRQQGAAKPKAPHDPPFIPDNDEDSE